MPRVVIRCEQRISYKHEGKMSSGELRQIAKALTGSSRDHLQPQDVGCDEVQDVMIADNLEPDEIEIIVDGKYLDIEALRKLAR